MIEPVSITLSHDQNRLFESNYFGTLFFLDGQLFGTKNCSYYHIFNHLTIIRLTVIFKWFLIKKEYQFWSSFHVQSKKKKDKKTTKH